MNINVKEANRALISLLEDNTQIVFLDANFFIPPDRSRMGAKPVSFQKYKEYWLEPLFDAFPNLSVHETVYEELVDNMVREFADRKIGGTPSRLRVYKDSELTATEKNLLELQIQKLIPYSGYIPERDNAKDRGEVRSLAYMAVKNYLYFAANDNLPVKLINRASELETGLEDMMVLQAYEIIYYLYTTGKYDSKGLRMLYKYQYHLTEQEKKKNPEWGVFVAAMDALYNRK
jgi:hypothetical protein